MKNKTITIIGAGNLGLSIANGLAKKGFLKENKLILTKRSFKNVSTIPTGVETTADNKLAVEKADIIIICVQPHHIDGLIEVIRSAINNNQIIISTVTGLSLESLHEKLPGQTLIRAMPNTAIAVGESMTCIAGKDLSESDIENAKSIFDQLGNSLLIEEELMQAATVICASGIAFWMRLIRANCQGAIQLGFEAKMAQQLVMQTCKGAVELLESNQSHPEQEVDKVTTPAGCTVRGLNQMEFHGLSSAIIKGLEASFEQITKIAAGK